MESINTLLKDGFIYYTAKTHSNVDHFENFIGYDGIKSGYSVINENPMFVIEINYINTVVKLDDIRKFDTLFDKAKQEIAFIIDEMTSDNK
jgi:hypothetical protein